MEAGEREPEISGDTEQWKRRKMTARRGAEGEGEKQEANIF